MSVALPALQRWSVGKEKGGWGLGADSLGLGPILPLGYKLQD